MMLDAVPGELFGEIAEVLREHPHGGGVEQVLEAGVQAQPQHVAHADRVDRADRGVGGGEAHLGREVMDRVDAPGQVVERSLPQAQMRLANVAGHHADAGRERLVPDPGLLHGGAQALQPVLGVGRPYQAVHDQVTVHAQEFAQHEAAHEPGRPGQQHLPHLRDRHRRGRPAVTDGAANERAQAVQVALTLRRQRSGKRRYAPVGCGRCVRHRQG